MRKNTIFILILCLLPAVTFGLALPASQALAETSTVPHTSYPAAKDWVPNVPYTCATPLDESNVTQIVGIASGSPQDYIIYNTTSLTVNEGACVKFVYKNLSPDIYHSFVIDKVSSTGNTNNQVDDANLNNAEINAIDMDIANSTSDVGFGPGVNVFYAWMPKVQSSFTYYCSEPGHEAAGEKGTLYVGTATQTATLTAGGTWFSDILSLVPGFEAIELFLAFIPVTILIRKRKN